MSSSYDHVMPVVFPKMLILSVASAEKVAFILNQASKVCVNGSSFAITADAPSGHRKVWLSKASADRLLPRGYRPVNSKQEGE